MARACHVNGPAPGGFTIARGVKRRTAGPRRDRHHGEETMPCRSA
jgi:hypothetical protein